MKIENIFDHFKDFTFKIVDYDLNQPIEGNDDIFIEKYKFQNPNDTMKFKCGTCWDISYCSKIEIEKFGYESFCIYLETNEDSKFPNNHMFTIFIKDGKFYTFEANFKDLLGIKGSYDSLIEICKLYVKTFILKYKGFSEISFYKIDNFPSLYSNVVEVMQYLKENNEQIYFYTSKKFAKFEHAYRTFIRRISESPPKILNEEIKYTLYDIIIESDLPSPYFLKKDITDKLQKTNLIKYSRSDIMKFANGWKFENELKNMNDDFSLTIIECNENDIEKLLGFNLNVQGQMCECVNPENMYDEYIWIKPDYFKEYDEAFSTLLSHELGHVWTSLFGFSNDEFNKGRTDFNDENFPTKLNEFQKDVLISLYERNLQNLKNDYNYVLRNQKETNDNWELTTHTDEIIEILINDYLLNHSREDSQNYLIDIFNRLENSKKFNDFSLLDMYSGKTKIENFNNLNYVKNIIRRLFLIFSFGNKKQIEYFKNICFDEFSKKSV